MGKARLEYDDSGATFYYFLLSFYGIILLPITYFLLPRKKKSDDEGKGLVCQCEPCLAKKALLEADRPSQWLAKFTRYGVLVVLWSVFIFMLYKVLTADKDYEEYDPFEILQLDPDASMGEIKKQFRKLSIQFHPDKQGGNQEMFMKIAKAHEALTDEVSRENWRTYGNPDGPQAISFGIALPSWIVEKQNSLWVLALYMGLFMVVLPLIVGVWWYRSIKYGSSNILIQTTQLFIFLLNKHRNIPLKRLLMILTAAMEFSNELSQLLPSRPSDNVELSRIIASRSLPHVNAKTKERFMGMPYSVKARILLHSHLERVPLNSQFLETDQKAMLKKCPQLLQEMISILSQLWGIHLSRGELPPSLDLFEEVMKCSGIIVQGMWLTGSSPLLQLPHLSREHLRHFRTKKRNIASIEQFMNLPATERRSLVRTLSDEEYSDVLAVCAKFPQVSISAETKVVDDDDTSHITVSSLVTLSVTLERQCLQTNDVELSSNCELQNEDVRDEVETLGSGGDEGRGQDSTTPVSTIQSSRGKRGKKGPAKKAKGQMKVRRKTLNPKKAKKNDRAAVAAAQEEDESAGSDDEKTSHGREVVRRRGKGPSSQHVKDQENGSSDDEGQEGDNEERAVGEKEEEEEWHRLQQDLQKHSKKVFEQAATESHPVHAPYFPEEKQEIWWLYVADRKRKDMICLPKKITGLMTTQTTDLHFSAPKKPGQYRYSIILRSDSYLDLSFSQELKLNVGEHQDVVGRNQWADLEEEEEQEEMIEESFSEGSWNDDDQSD